jgi:6-phosphofructokinase 1
MLFVIGGQGGNQLGAQLAEGCQRRRIPCCIVGVPKSIDNDVMLMDKTFGFDTVVQVRGLCCSLFAQEHRQ